ncbi:MULTISPECIES: hypothetical protein [Paraburkholderia]|uniref:Uncharacterized protein n=1 Tax=Paraburkholderia dipogonis TaxID=1211383 RepID=A0A4Y8MH07_9BURK|nr:MULTISPECIES: hypothetical protein [Paraburkholderia]RKR31364.1 hypothetical protein B0G82_7511 [Paraburkholderia sp. BL17N1]TFE36674.1 hypothetical protein E2553_44195 [Paraburkholderia dipogonis]
MSDASDALDLTRRLVNENTHAVSVIGARAIVFIKFLNAMLPYLTAALSAEVSQSLRRGIEDVLAMMDDVPRQHT